MSDSEKMWNCVIKMLIPLKKPKSGKGYKTVGPRGGRGVYRHNLVQYYASNSLSDNLVVFVGKEAVAIIT